MNGPGKESMKRKYKIAMVQMDTQNNKEKNLEDACAWIDEAAASGAELVCFPEVMNLIGKNTGPGGGQFTQYALRCFVQVFIHINKTSGKFHIVIHFTIIFTRTFYK